MSVLSQYCNRQNNKFVVIFIEVPMEHKGKGKCGGSRVIYVDIELKETIYFINVYTKDEKDDLTDDEKRAFKAAVKILKGE